MLVPHRPQLPNSPSKVGTYRTCLQSLRAPTCTSPAVCMYIVGSSIMDNALRVASWAPPRTASHSWRLASTSASPFQDSLNVSAPEVHPPEPRCKTKRIGCTVGSVSNRRQSGTNAMAPGPSPDSRMFSTAAIVRIRISYWRFGGSVGVFGLRHYHNVLANLRRDGPRRQFDFNSTSTASVRATGATGPDSWVIFFACDLRGRPLSSGI